MLTPWRTVREISAQHVATLSYETLVASTLYPWLNSTQIPAFLPWGLRSYSGWTLLRPVVQVEPVVVAGTRKWANKSRCSQWITMTRASKTISSLSKCSSILSTNSPQRTTSPSAWMRKWWGACASRKSSFRTCITSAQTCPNATTRTWFLMWQLRCVRTVVVSSFRTSTNLRTWKTVTVPSASTWRRTKSRPRCLAPLLICACDYHYLLLSYVYDCRASLFYQDYKRMRKLINQNFII